LGKDETKKEAEAAAAGLKNKGEAEKAILAEAMNLESGKQHSMQRLFAYVKQYKKHGGK